jgi:hypothetical protein
MHEKPVGGLALGLDCQREGSRFVHGVADHGSPVVVIMQTQLSHRAPCLSRGGPCPAGAWGFRHDVLTCPSSTSVGYVEDRHPSTQSHVEGGRSCKSVT